MDSRGLRIQLLGRFSVSVNGQAVEEGAWRLRKARNLMKLVALAPGNSLHRDVALEALWPERGAEAARNNLRQAVFVARRALDCGGGDGAGWLALSQDVLSLTPAAEAAIDVAEFEAAADAAARRGDVESLRAALDLYGGELLPEDRFEEWTLARREALRERHLSLLVELAARHHAAGDPASAVAALQSALGEDQFHEGAHRGLMRLYAATGRRQRALSQYHLLRETLLREVADDPEPETRRLYQDLLARRDGAAAADPIEPGGRIHRRRAAPPNNLPLQLTSFVGRERQLDDVHGMLGRARLVTLTGAGGSGKTRLALEVAARSLPDFKDGAWLVELGPLGAPELVPTATATAIGAPLRSRRLPEEAIAAHISDRSLLILLDNCEHLIEASARLAESLLTRCPNLKILATSREPLGVQGEVDARVPSLTLPDPEGAQAPDELARFESVRLFAERAATAAPDFELTDATGPWVAEICRRVDGMPLALELAAARVAVLSVAEIAERLSDSLSVLSAGPRTALTRQRTLTATIDWSHELLDDRERALFRRLGVFAGSVNLAAVEDICAGAPIDRPDVLEVLSALVTKSLVLSEDEVGESRFRLLVPLRQYARDRLLQSGENESVEARHRRHFAELAGALEPGLVAVDPAPALARLELDYDDLRAALRSAVAEAPELALLLAQALWRYWAARSRFAEGCEWLTAALEGATEPSGLRATALVALSVLSLRVGEVEEAFGAATESITVARASGEALASAEALHHAGGLDFLYHRGPDEDRLERSLEFVDRIGSSSLRASVLHTLALRADWRGDPAGAEPLLDESLRLLRELPAQESLTLPFAVAFVVTPEGPDGSPRIYFEETLVAARRVRAPEAVGYVLASLGAVRRNAGRGEAAREPLEQALALFRDLGDVVGAAVALGQIGNLLRLTGDHETARELLEDCLALREQRGDRRETGLALGNLGLLAARMGEFGRARELVDRAYRGFLATADQPGEGHFLAHLGYVAMDAGELAEARRMLEQAKKVWALHHIDWRPTAWMDVSLAVTARLEGDDARARRHTELALNTFRAIGEAAGIAWCEAANAQLTGR